MTDLSNHINTCWEQQKKPDAALLATVLTQLDQGLLRVASCSNGVWETHSWLKKAILLFFKHTPSHRQGSENFPFYDKAPLKGAGWRAADFEQAGFRMAPGAVVRRGAYIGKSVVLMPCFVNIGAYVDDGTMVDTMARVGSCAQVGKNCHIAAGVGIGGVLEPPQATPVIIEDNCFIGAQSQIVEGAKIGEGSVIGMGTMIGGSTKVIDRISGKISFGEIPPYSVVVPGSYKTSDTLSLRCAVIIKKVDATARAKTAVNDLLRD